MLTKSLTILITISMLKLSAIQNQNFNVETTEGQLLENAAYEANQVNSSSDATMSEQNLLNLKNDQTTENRVFTNSLNLAGNGNAVNTNGSYLNQQVNQQVSQRVYESKPVITQRLISQPIITQKLISQPIIKRRIVQQPVIKKRIIQKKLINQTKNVPAVVTNRQIRRNVMINVPGNTITNNTVVQPSLHTRTENVNFVRTPTQTIRHRPIVRAVQTKTENRQRTFTAPAQTITHHTRVLPINNIVRENVRLNQLPAQYSTMPAQRLAPRVNQTQRVQNFQAPGNEIHSHTTVQPTLQRNQATLQVVRQPTQYRTNQVITRAPQVQNRVSQQVVQRPGHVTVNQPIVQNHIQQRRTNIVTTPVMRQRVTRRVLPIPTPVVKEVQIVKKIPYVVKLPKAKPIENTQNINVYVKKRKNRKARVVYREPEQRVRYRKNYEREVSNDGFYHPENNDRENRYLGNGTNSLSDWASESEMRGGHSHGHEHVSEEMIAAMNGDENYRASQRIMGESQSRSDMINMTGMAHRYGNRYAANRY